MGSDSRNLGLGEEFIVLDFVGLLALRVRLPKILDECRCLRLKGSVQDVSVKALFDSESSVLDCESLLHFGEVLKGVRHLGSVFRLFD